MLGLLALPVAFAHISGHDPSMSRGGLKPLKVEKNRDLSCFDAMKADPFIMKADPFIDAKSVKTVIFR